MSRKLATVIKITELLQIEGADRIVLASNSVNSWRCIVGKAEFQTGDYGVYFEIDSMLPKEDVYAVLKGRCESSNGDGKDGYRIKTMKMKGVVSQGFIMPLSAFPNLQGAAEGADVTKELGVFLYEREKPQQHSKGNAPKTRDFPWYIRKTDQERLQSVPKVLLEQFCGKTWEVTEKLDGSSVTVFCVLPSDYEKYLTYGVCSRNLNLYLRQDSYINWWINLWTGFIKKVKFAKKFREFGFDISDYEQTAASYNLQEKLIDYCRQSGRSLAIQAEMVGPGVQKNRMGLKTKMLAVFDVYDIGKQSYVSAEERKKIATLLELPHVPVFDPVFTAEKIDVEVFIERSKGSETFSGNSTMREGLVYKQIENPNISFKVINNDYLLKNNE